MFRRVIVSRIVLAFLLTTIAPLFGTVSAQELAPRAYWPTPNGTNVLVLAYQKSTGDIVTDPSLPLTGVDSDIDYLQLSYQRTFSLAGRTSTMQLSVPYSQGRTEGLVDGEFLSRDTSGMGDARLRLSYNISGAPSMDAAGFKALRAAPQTIVGASLLIQAPSGDYEADKVINIGTNRWSIKPAIGVIWPMRPTWLLEFELGAWLFGDNDDFLGETRKQDPILSAEFHLVKRIQSGFWASLDVTKSTRGERDMGSHMTSTDGLRVYQLLRGQKEMVHGEYPDRAYLLRRGAEIVMQEFGSDRPFENELKGKSRYEGQKPVGDVACDVVYVEYKTAGEHARWFFGPDHFPRRVERMSYMFSDLPKDQQMKKTLTISNLDTAPKLAASDFRLTLPEGYKDHELKPPAPLLTVGTEAPDWELKTPEGKTVSLASLRGNVVLMDFWATWCGPCKMAMPGIQKIHEHFEGKPVTVVGVNCQEQNGDPAGYMAKKNYTYTLLMMAYTMNNVPYSALTGVMTGDPGERTTISTYRFFAAMAAAFIVQGLTLPLVDKFGAGDDAKAEKCTFCSDRLDGGEAPICVGACPTRALDCGDIEELSKRPGTTRTMSHLPDGEQTTGALLVKAKP